MQLITLLRLLGARFRRNQAILLASLATLAVLAGAVLFSVTQGVSFGTALYWAVTTATTVGYGDVTPHNAAGRVVAVGVMLSAVPLFGAVFAVLAGAAASIRIRRILGMARPFPDPPYSVICGTHPTLARVVEELLGAGRSVVVVGDATLDLPEQVHLVKGDPTEEAVLRRSRPEGAEQALVLGSDDGDVLVTVVTLRHIAPALEISALTSSDRVAGALRDLGVSRTLASDELLAHTLAKSLEAPHAGDLLLRLLDSDAYRLRELPAEQAWVGQSLHALRAQLPSVVMGLVQGGSVIVGVERNPVVGIEDHLLVLQAEPEHRVLP